MSRVSIIKASFQSFESDEYEMVKAVTALCAKLWKRSYESLI